MSDRPGMSETSHERSPSQRRTVRRRPYVRRCPSALSRRLNVIHDASANHLSIEHRELSGSLIRDGVCAVEGVLERERCARVYGELLRQLESNARPEFGNIHGKDARLDLPLRMTRA